MLIGKSTKKSIKRSHQGICLMMYNRDIVLYIYTGISMTAGDSEWTWWIAKVWNVWTIPEGYGFYTKLVWWWGCYMFALGYEYRFSNFLKTTQVLRSKKIQQYHITFTDHITPLTPKWTSPRQKNGWIPDPQQLMDVAQNGDPQILSFKLCKGLAQAYGGFPEIGVPKLAGLSWKIPSINGWWLGVPLWLRNLLQDGPPQI